MARLPGDLLERAPEESTRLLALSFLREAEQAYRRVERGGDAEALHDFRVAIRRLRSCCRAYRDQLSGSVSRKLRGRLRGLTETTNAGRDAEVLLAWIREHAGDDDPGGGIAWLIQRLEERRQGAQDSTTGELGEEVRHLVRTLRERLSEFQTTVHIGGGGRHHPRFRGVVAGLIQAHVEELRAALAAISGPAAAAEIHLARIRGKRLRYLLEPLASRRKIVAGFVQRLKELQTLAGDVRDMHVLGQEIVGAVEAVAAGRARRQHRLALAGADGGIPAEPPGQSLGLIQLAREAHDREQTLYRELEAGWLGGRADPLLDRIVEYGKGLKRRPPRRVEIERKYLLSQLPPRAAQHPFMDIDQGWLAGTELNERVRRIRNHEGESFTRTVKLGGGIARTELEEATTSDIFAALWPLTEGRRVEKRRYLVPDGELKWEIDDFKDRNLVLAEVELPSEHTPVTVPDWLQPYVVREVTAEPEYLNIILAR